MYLLKGKRIGLGYPGKILEAIINQFFNTWKRVDSMKHQKGFLNSKSCQTHLILFCDSTTSHRDKENDSDSPSYFQEVLESALCLIFIDKLGKI